MECSSSCWFNLSECDSAHYLSSGVDKREGEATAANPKHRTEIKWTPWQKDFSPVWRLTLLFSLLKMSECCLPFCLGWWLRASPSGGKARSLWHILGLKRNNLCKQGPQHTAPEQSGAPSTQGKNHPIYCFFKESLVLLKKNPILLWGKDTLDFLDTLFLGICLRSWS